MTVTDPAYDAGWHDGVDYGYRLAEHDLDTCPQCGHTRTPSDEDAPGD